MGSYIYKAISKLNINMNENKSGVYIELLKPENWPLPKWLDEKKLPAKPNYRDYFVHQFRTIYVELEGEFRTVVGNYPPGDFPTANKIFNFLQSARKALEKKETDLLSISHTLNMVERYMVWIYPSHITNARVITILARLKSLRPVGWVGYHEKITDLSKNEDDKKLLYEDESIRKQLDEKYGTKQIIDNQIERQRDLRFGYLRAVLDEAIGACNKKIVDEQISNGLQIERLETLFLRGIGLLLLLLLVSPLATNLATLKDWPSQLITQWVLMASWLNALGIVIMGATGGFLSGLLQARSSRVNQIEYQENMLKLQIKPLIGAIFSLILYVLLSWQILPGISIQNIGSYFFIAFLSGFSERYFLQMLELKAGKEETSYASEEMRPKKENSTTPT